MATYIRWASFPWIIRKSRILIAPEFSQRWVVTQSLRIDQHPQPTPKQRSALSNHCSTSSNGMTYHPGCRLIPIYDADIDASLTHSPRAFALSYTLITDSSTPGRICCLRSSIWVHWLVSSGIYFFESKPNRILDRKITWWYSFMLSGLWFAFWLLYADVSSFLFFPFLSFVLFLHYFILSRFFYAHLPSFGLSFMEPAHTLKQCHRSFSS